MEGWLGLACAFSLGTACPQMGESPVLVGEGTKRSVLFFMCKADICTVHKQMDTYLGY